MNHAILPSRVLMTLDAVGGVWRYAMDLAKGLTGRGIDVVFAGFGPRPDEAKLRETLAIGNLVWLDAPLDWMASQSGELVQIPSLLQDLVARHEIDLVHLNLPSQAANLELSVPIVAASHSCVVTWFAGVRNAAVPDDWAWQRRLNAAGFERADVVLAPSRSHAVMLETSYGPIPALQVVHNASALDIAPASKAQKEPFVFAAGRWWDEGKNGAVLDAAAGRINWPLVLAGSAQGPNGQSTAFVHADHRGELGHRQTMDLMHRAAIVVSPSIYEPFGLAALEAARLGAALVLADIPTYRELWEDCALFADPHRPEAFAAAINRLSQDADLRTRMQNRARERSHHFTLKRQTDEICRVYTAALAGTRTPAIAEHS
jgi:glycosyltransferase involved in cell wall biosynthesis